jgi:hypothetical protein
MQFGGFERVFHQFGLPEQAVAALLFLSAIASV